MREYDTALGAGRIVPVYDPRWHMWRPRYAQPLVLSGPDSVDVDAALNDSVSLRHEHGISLGFTLGEQEDTQECTVTTVREALEANGSPMTKLQLQQALQCGDRRLRRLLKMESICEVGRTSAGKWYWTEDATFVLPEVVKDDTCP